MQEKKVFELYAPRDFFHDFSFGYLMFKRDKVHSFDLWIVCMKKEIPFLANCPALLSYRTFRGKLTTSTWIVLIPSKNSITHISVEKSFRCATPTFRAYNLASTLSNIMHWFIFKTHQSIIIKYQQNNVQLVFSQLSNTCVCLCVFVAVERVCETKTLCTTCHLHKLNGFLFCSFIFLAPSLLNWNQASKKKILDFLINLFSFN